MLDCLDTAAATEWLAGCYGYVMASCVVSGQVCAVSALWAASVQVLPCTVSPHSLSHSFNIDIAATLSHRPLSNAGVGP